MMQGNLSLNGEPLVQEVEITLPPVSMTHTECVEAAARYYARRAFYAGVHTTVLKYRGYDG